MHYVKKTKSKLDIITENENKQKLNAFAQSCRAGHMSTVL